MKKKENLATDQTRIRPRAATYFLTTGMTQMIEIRNALGRILLLCAIVCALGSLYVLSIGPAAWIVTRTGGGEEAVRCIYTPVIWLHDNTSLKDPLAKYVEFFERN